jgi:hypothetical protein
MRKALCTFHKRKQSNQTLQKNVRNNLNKGKNGKRKGREDKNEEKA